MTPNTPSTPNAPHLSIDRTVCSGHGRCYALAPELFGGDDEGYGEVIGQPRPDQVDHLRSVAQNCPEGAIHLTEPDQETSP